MQLSRLELFIDLAELRGYVFSRIKKIREDSTALDSLRINQIGVQGKSITINGESILSLMGKWGEWFGWTAILSIIVSKDKRKIGLLLDDFSLSSKCGSALLWAVSIGRSTEAYIIDMLKAKVAKQRHLEFCDRTIWVDLSGFCMERGLKISGKIMGLEVSTTGIMLDIG